MKFPALSRTGFAVALSAVLVSMAAPVMAEDQGSNNIFSQVAPSFRDRMFFKLNYISANVKTTSGDAYDVTGPVLSLQDVRNLGQGGSYTYPAGSSNGWRRQYYLVSNPSSQTTVYGVLRDALVADAAASGCDANLNGIGTPCGMRARSQATVGTPSLSLGYYFTDDMDWFVEAQVLAAPLKVNIYGDGPTAINGQKIITLKMLPPTVVLGRYFGDKKDNIRPFIGFGASYAYFYDVKATDFLNSYVGGSSAGDTTINLKNTLGVGAFVGLKANVSEDWSLSFNVGKLRYKTEATITTANTYIDGNSQVLSAYGANTRLAIGAGGAIMGTDPNRSADGIYNMMCDLAAAKGNAPCNQGTFVRKQSTTLDATMFMVGIGHSF